MAKSENQKMKLLYILKIFYEKTDEKHTITVRDIIDELSRLNISAARRSVYDDIRTLKDFGIDIISQKSKTCSYFLGSRRFEPAELKILIDSIQSSRFITQKKSVELIKKIESLASRSQAQSFHRQLYIRDRVKTMNECIYYTVDSIHNAISENRQIMFKYFDYDIEKKRIFRKDGKPYITNPIALTFDNGNYYLIAYNSKHNNYVHYRVDKMIDIILAETKRDLPEGNFNAASYVKPIFSMFDGEEADITAVFHISYVGVIIDRFGENITMKKVDDYCFKVRFKAAISPVFLSWIISFGGGVKILSPDWVAEKVCNLALETIKTYENEVL